MARIDRYREFMAGKGLRVTRDRERVVKEIFALNEPFDAERLVAQLAGRVSRSTIYRTLQNTEDAGLIRRVPRHDNRQFYEHT